MKKLIKKIWSLIKFCFYCAVALLIYTVCIEPYMLESTPYVVENHALSGVKIVFATDFHVGPYPWEKWRLQRIVRKINEQNPDLVLLGGAGHSAALYTDTRTQERVDYFAKKIPTFRLLINSPSSHGGIGDLFNFRLEPSLTLGCGSWGGNAVSGDVGVENLLNYKTVAERRENMLWFKVPPKIYFKRGATDLALRVLKGKKRAFIVTDRFLFNDHGSLGSTRIFLL